MPRAILFREIDLRKIRYIIFRQIFGVGILLIISLTDSFHIVVHNTVSYGIYKSILIKLFKEENSFISLHSVWSGDRWFWQLFLPSPLSVIISIHRYQWGIQIPWYSYLCTYINSCLVLYQLPFVFIEEMSVQLSSKYVLPFLSQIYMVWRGLTLDPLKNILYGLRKNVWFWGHTWWLIFHNFCV